jgi:hypothetical protein
MHTSWFKNVYMTFYLNKTLSRMLIVCYKTLVPKLDIAPSLKILHPGAAVKLLPCDYEVMSSKS